MPARFAEDVITDNDNRAPMDLGVHNYPNNRTVINDDIAISGFSGRLPESSTIDEFKKNLMAGVDMVNDDPRRWEKGLYGLPERIGKLKDEDLKNFDQQFFGVSPKQAECMDPQLRMLLEVTHEAIVDAGINPVDIRGSRTGVYVGCSNSESEQHWCSTPELVNGYGLTGCSRAMFANRVSYTFDFKGPSYSVDTACSSSMYALEQAFSDMRSGKCDSAIVAGVGLILRPTMSLQFKRLNMLSPDGMCKAFDESGNGYVRSDGLGVLFLQRTACSKRVYATILNVRTNTDGFKENGITYPDGRIQNRLIRETYEEIKLDPNDVAYIEAHGTGTKVGDPQEVNSISDFFCKNRKTPLLIGSVKSNMGHSEPASGVCSIAKVLIAMEEGVLPGNLHFSKPNPDLHGLIDGHLKVVDKNTPWNGGIVGINSFGFGGANAHVILKSNPKPKAITTRDGLPKLVICSGRTSEAVQELLEDATLHREDDEYLGLINDIHSRTIPLHPYRGYGVVSGKGSLQLEVLEYSDEKRPIWYVYSGMGSQWASMAKDLMHFDVFNKSIHRCAEVLRPEGIDLIELVTHSTDQSFENILNSFVSIAAVQVALTDLLSSLNIQPEGIVGHSVGELGCAYADGCFTPEQTVLAAYWRGKSILDTQLPKGRMAAVGLNWDDAHSRLPSDCFPVCHNSEDNCTISGPESSIDALIEKLTAEGIFAKAVNSSGYAFHSKYIADAGPKLRKSLEKIIPNPKNRTSRWLSTSIPENAWNNAIAKQSSAAYHVNNLLSPVLFHEALQHIPKNAICIEIAPTGLLQAILKRALGSGTTNLSLAKRNHENNIEFCLMNIGKLFAAGSLPQVGTLVRPISYPVGRGTPMLNSKIKWDHTQKWFVSKFDPRDSASGETIVEIDLSKEEDAYLAGHTIDGRILFPATGYMTLAWMTFAKMRGVEIQNVPVVMENLVFHRATILNKEGVVKFGINFFDGTGAFEICEGGSLAVSGKISLPENIEREELPLDPLETDQTVKQLNTNDAYKELRLRGYDYGGIFRGIVKSDLNASVGNLQWVDNWVSFMDTMLQFSILSKNLRELYLPTRIERAVINPAKHLELLSQLSTEAQAEVGLPVYMYNSINVIKSGGVELRGLKASLAQRRPAGQNPPTLERYGFIPSLNSRDLHENSDKARDQALSVAVHLVIENSGGALKVKGVELANGRNPDILIAPKLLQLIEGEPTITADIAIVTTNTNEEAIAATFGDDSGLRVISKNIVIEPVEQNCHLLYGKDVLSRPDTAVLENSIATIKETGFLLFEENVSFFDKTGRKLLEQYGFSIVQEQSCGSTRVLVMARRGVDLKSRKSVVINVSEKNFDWLETLKSSLAKAEVEDTYVYIVSQGEELFGALGLINCVKNEAGGKFARMVYVQDPKAEKFSLTSAFYRKQMEKDLISNVLKQGVWGTFRHLKLETDVATLQVEHAYVNALVKGDLASLKWIEGPQTGAPPTADNLDMCTVYYAPVNFRDVMLSSGKLSADALPGDLAQQDCVLGLEFAGRDSEGHRIMAMVAAKSLATTCLASKNMMWKIPDSWSMEQASTVPCVYATVYYALMVRGQMKKGEKILIHAGSGGVGQAAIAVALHHGLTVFTTVGSIEKREFLKQRFPQLQDAYIGNSRDTSFEQLVMRKTQGQGVDLVLNSLSEEKLQASVRCLGLNGRFLEIGKFDLSNNSPLGMSVFLKNTSFHGILLDSVMEGEEEMQQQVVRLVAEGIKNGAVRPLPTSVFNKAQIEQAFRFMASGKHIGKVVIKVREEEDAGEPIKPVLRVNAIPRTYMHPEKCYIIVGGLGGFGLELTNWLVVRGARLIVLTSRSGIKTGYQALMIQRWTDRGVKVVIDTNDVTTSAGCKALLQNANKLGLVGGIYNLAAVLRDALIEDQTVENYQIVCDAKVAGTKFLDQHSRVLCHELDYFVCFSSVSCGRGNIGQSNYGLANSTMERICEQRQANGFPGTSIQWGAIGDTGLVIENLGDNDTVIGGTLPQRMASCLQTIDLFLQQPYPVLASMVVADKRKTDGSSGVSLVSCVANILGLRDIKNVQDSATLADLGIDSLMGAEIKQTMERNFDIVLSVNEIRVLTFGALRQMGGEGGGSPIAAAQTPEVPIPTSPVRSPAAVNSSISSSSIRSMTPPQSPMRVASPTMYGDETQVVFSTELMPKEDIVQMKTAAPKNSTKLPIFFVSPIEGFATALESLAERLMCPAYGLQCTEKAPMESIDSIAQYYLKHVRTVQPVGPYNIAGYSFGALIAYVMVTELEKNNEEVQLVFLDGAPKYVTWHTTNFKQRHNTEDTHILWAHSLAYFSMVVANCDYAGVARSLLTIPTQQGKIDKCGEIVSAVISQPIEMITKAAVAFYKKLDAADKYKPLKKLKCNVTLVKPTQNFSKLEEDYGLNEVCIKKVDVFTVEGNHRTFLQEQDSLNTIESILNGLIK